MTESKTGTRSVRSSIEIDATPEQVWEMISTGEGLSRWFPVEAKVTPGEGGEIWFSWGKTVMEGTSKIVTWEPPRRMVSEWGGMHDEFQITSRGGNTTLSIVSNGFGEGADWDEMYDSVTTGWMFELGGLKHALEHHSGVERDVVRCLRRCEPDRDALAARLLNNGLAPGTDLRSANADDSISIMLDGMGEVEAQVRVANQPKDMSIVTPSLNDAYWRIQIEAPCSGSDKPALDVTLWASTYGLSDAAQTDLRAAMNATLDRLLGKQATVVDVG